MTTSRTQPSNWMFTDGNGKVLKDDIVKRAAGWVKIHPNGYEELIHALSDIGNVAAIISSVTNPTDGTFNDQTQLSFSVIFSEPVDVSTVGGTPSIKVYTVEGDEYDIPYVSGTGTATLVFQNAIGGLTGIADGSLVVIEEVTLNGGTILDVDAGNWVDNDFPADYVQPTITMTTV